MTTKTPFDYRESTITYDYESREVEFYFTRESNYRKLMDRNPNYTSAKELNPGFTIVYPFREITNTRISPSYAEKIEPSENRLQGACFCLHRLCLLKTLSTAL